MTHEEMTAARATAERERDEARAELAALRTEIHEENLRDNYRAEHGCGDNSCVVERPHGMATNGGCRCGSRTLRAALQRARAELAKERADLALLTARVETEIPAVAAAVRGKTIAECVAMAMELCASYEARANLPHAKGTSLWSQRMTQAAVASEVAEALRALATPQPAPSDSLDVDPAAGALR